MKEILTKNNGKEYLGLSQDSSKDFKIEILVSDINYKLSDWMDLDNKTAEELVIITERVKASAYKYLEETFNIEQGIQSISDDFEKVVYKKVDNNRIPLALYNAIEPYLLKKYKPFSFLSGYGEASETI